MYIEMLAGGGLLGAAAFSWLLWRTAERVTAAVRHAVHDRAACWRSASRRAGVAIAIHGLVDSFLSFTPTYIMIAITLGLAVAVRARPGDRHGRMRIAFDGTALRPGRTGVGYYTEHLLHHLARTATNDELIVVSNRAIDTTSPLPSRVRIATPSLERAADGVDADARAGGCCARSRPTSSTSLTACCR